MPELLLAAVALAAGYTLGRVRLGTRAFDWADRTGAMPEITRRTVRWWLTQPVFAVVILGLFIAEPRRAAHAWRHRNDPPPGRVPAPTVHTINPEETGR
ncbi:hypothetical protein ACIPXV_02935 [Streptomyces libani]|uniref:hypothetical protein n=1 Tax=Streptomyces nigrescens TaxID=1920 RepID=UPI00382414ED